MVRDELAAELREIVQEENNSALGADVMAATIESSDIASRRRGGVTTTAKAKADGLYPRRRRLKVWYCMYHND